MDLVPTTNELSLSDVLKKQVLNPPPREIEQVRDRDNLAQLVGKASEEAIKHITSLFEENKRLTDLLKEKDENKKLESLLHEEQVRVFQLKAEESDAALLEMRKEHDQLQEGAQKRILEEIEAREGAIQTAIEEQRATLEAESNSAKMKSEECILDLKTRLALLEQEKLKSNADLAIAQEKIKKALIALNNEDYQSELNCIAVARNMRPHPGNSETPELADYYERQNASCREDQRHVRFKRSTKNIRDILE